MANPNPTPPPTNGQWQPGQSGNPAGKPKGTKSWSTIVQNLLEDDKLAENLIAKKPSWWDKLPNKNAGNAIVAAMVIKAMGGDTKAATWLRKTGFGDKLDITSNDDNIQPVFLYDMRLGTITPSVPALEAQPKPKRKAPAKKKPAAKKGTAKK